MKFDGLHPAFEHRARLAAAVVADAPRDARLLLARFMAQSNPKAKPAATASRMISAIANPPGLPSTTRLHSRPANSPPQTRPSIHSATGLSESRKSPAMLIAEKATCMPP